jgi:hypothetical protein
MQYRAAPMMRSASAMKVMMLAVSETGSAI